MVDQDAPHDLGRDAEEMSPALPVNRPLLDQFEGRPREPRLLAVGCDLRAHALESEEKRRGPMNSKGLAQLAYEKGMYVLTASQSYQAALEVDQLGQGLLTFALVEEGLKSAAAISVATGDLGVGEWWNG